MKRSILLLSAIAFIVIGIATQFQDAMSSKADTCCQDFQVLDANGQPMAGCTVTITCTTFCQCTMPPGKTKCTICGLTSGTSYTATTSCCSGSTTFTACVGSTLITIQCP